MLAGDGGRFWQFHPGGPARTPLTPAAVYLDAGALESLLPLMRGAARWFIADGVSRLDDPEVRTLEGELRAASRMPDEPGNTAAYAALADWLAGHRGDPIWVQQQRFSARQRS